MAHSVLFSVTALALLCVVYGQTQKPTTKAPTLLQELGQEFRKLGEKVLKTAVVGTMAIGCRTCPRMCEHNVGQYFCLFLCAPCGGGRGKRSIREHRGHLTPLPNKFSSYDLNDDGVVSVKELAFTVGQGASPDNMIQVFTMADTNGDNVLSPSELYSGPFVFEMDVSDTDNMHCQYMAKRMSRPSSGNTISK